jgi:hypothetical protein
MKLAQEKLGSTLAEIDRFKEGDMARLAHAVAHLTQAGISLQRWNERGNQGAFERERVRPEGKSKFRAGLSAETSQALRNALLGIAPFDEERRGQQEPAPGRRETLAFPETQTAGGVEKHQEPSQTAPAAPLKGSESSDRQDDE